MTPITHVTELFTYSVKTIRKDQVNNFSGDKPTRGFNA